MRHSAPSAENMSGDIAKRGRTEVRKEICAEPSVNVQEHRSILYIIFLVFSSDNTQLSLYCTSCILEAAGDK